MRRVEWASVRSSPALPLLVAIVGAVLWFQSRQPLWHTDLWGHLTYGRLIWHSGTLPQIEPFMPLARGVPLVDTAWLSQLLGYLVTSGFGPAGMQFLQGAAVASCFALLAIALHRSTRSTLFVLAGLALFALLTWFPFRIARPQTAGVVLYCALICLSIRGRLRTADWIAVPLLFCAWANLHGSFVMGLALLGCECLGRTIDVAWRTRRMRSVLRDRRLRQLALLLLLAALAACANPYGVRLYSEVLAISRNPNLDDVSEWQPLAFATRHGRIDAAAGALMLLAWALGRRRMRAAEVFAVVGLAIATICSARMVIWWAPVAVLSFAVNAQTAWRRWHRAPLPARAPRREVKWTLIALVVGCLCVVLTPLGLQVLFGRREPPEMALAPQTPVAATEWLVAHPPAGQIFNPYGWGDYLVWAGPANIPVFVTSQAHLVPRSVWDDYMSVVRVSPGWREVLERYQVQTVIADRRRRSKLIAALKQDRDWRQVYDDPLAVIFVRAE